MIDHPQGIFVLGPSITFVKLKWEGRSDGFPLIIFFHVIQKIHKSERNK